jgi:hypothetical protein
MVRILYRKDGNSDNWFYVAMSGKNQIGCGISSFKPFYNEIERTVLTSGLTYRKVTSCREV